MKSLQVCLGVLTLTVTMASAINASFDGGNFDLSWCTVDGGGGTSTGGAFEISGTIGQHDAGQSMTGGSFEFAGGFWPGGVTPLPTCPADVAPPSGDGMVNIDDLVLVITSWGPGGGNGPADVNHDHTVNIDDLVSVIIAWGVCPG